MTQRHEGHTRDQQQSKRCSKCCGLCLPPVPIWLSQPFLAFIIPNISFPSIDTWLLCFLRLHKSTAPSISLLFCSFSPPCSTIFLPFPPCAASRFAQIWLEKSCTLFLSCTLISDCASVSLLAMPNLRPTNLLFIDNTYR